MSRYKLAIATSSFLVTSTVFGWLFASSSSIAQSTPFKTVPGTVVLAPGISVSRFEDPDYRVVCYFVHERGQISCLKK
jgi:hypothetical protein